MEGKKPGSNDNKRNRVSSSTSTDSDFFFNVNQAELEGIVQASVSKALQTFQEKMMDLVNSKFKELNSWINDVDAKFKTLDEKTTHLGEIQESKSFEDAITPALQNENKELKEKIQQLEAQVKDLQTKSKETTKWANRNEQYSRRNNIRIRGLTTTMGEDSKDSVTKFLNNQLNITGKEGNRIQITRGDLDAAHPLPNQPSQPPVTIIKFHDRETRDLVMKHRRHLKGKKIVLSDDLTKPHQKLLSNLRDSPGIESAWSWNGKVRGHVKSTNKVLGFDLYDPIPT